MATLSNFLSLCPLIAILRGVKPAEVEAVGKVLLDCGFAIIEIPLNSPDALSSLGRLSNRFGDRALIGAGTVTRLGAVSDIAAAGGRLVVMPHADTRIVRAARAAGLITLAGVLTPTEAFAVLDAGADGLKLFPAEIAGPSGLKAMRAVLPPETAVLPVGGVTPASLAKWLAAGAGGFGLGSALYKPGDSPDTVRDKALAFQRALAAARGTAFA